MSWLVVADSRSFEDDKMKKTDGIVLEEYIFLVGRIACSDRSMVHDLRCGCMQEGNGHEKQAEQERG